MFNEYKKALLNIKDYLKEQGVEVAEVIMWQGGFSHQGTEHGLNVIATVISIDNIKEQYCIPEYIVKAKETPPLRFMKYEQNLNG